MLNINFFDFTLGYLSFNTFLNEIIQICNLLFENSTHQIRNLSNFIFIDILLTQHINYSTNFIDKNWFTLNYIYLQILNDVNNLVLETYKINKIFFIFNQLNTIYLFICNFFLLIVFFIQNFLILQYFISKKGINFFILINKYILLYNAEKNMGALDDFLFFITFFILIIFYYFLGLFGIIFIFSKTLAITIYSINIFIFLTLTIPVCYFYFLGIVFPAFIRGAGISTNILIEFIFDLLSTIVVFCRFLIQNIRLIIILLAYFELMEFINLNYIFINFKNLFNTSLDLFISNTTLLSTLKFLIILITILILYTYYALHLLILGLMQIGIYVFITFGLFIFMYSCLSLIVKEKYFNK